MQVHHSVAAWREYRAGELAAPVAAGTTIGFVPTMGALHLGHVSLIERARAECDVVVLSIFVNPTQFNDPKDFEKYPQTLQADLEKLKAAGVDAVFLPQAGEMYADAYRFELREKELSKVMDGPKRPGHFEGVLTVVLKLFHIVEPSKAYFGEKDYQQLRLIQDMTKSLFLNIDVIPCETVRENDGLAMSSRNTLLTPTDRERAPAIFRAIRNATTAEAAARELTEAGFKVDYVEDHWGRRFAAAFLGNVRLIDNVKIS
jgi:pantoate--beta-alanine ligase